MYARVRHARIEPVLKQRVVATERVSKPGREAEEAWHAKKSFLSELVNSWQTWAGAYFCFGRS